MNQFEVLDYSVTFVRGASEGSALVAIVKLERESGSVFVHFLGTDDELPDDTWWEDRNSGRMHLPDTLLQSVIDVLRNEDPVFCVLYEGASRGVITTAAEPVGEGEAA